MNTKTVSLTRVALFVLGAAIVAGSTSAQAPQPPQDAPGGAAPRRQMPKPTNLKVLPPDITGEQLMQTMHGWASQLGTGCTTCHAVDATRTMPNGRPMMNFADDSKKEKQTARLMYKMLNDVNVNYVSKVGNSDAKVTCGTCHRGHLIPEAYVPATDEHEHHDHPAPGSH